jgi:hypothetical protein
MEELIGQIVANVGLEKPIAERAVAIILNFLAAEGPPDKVQALLERLPGARLVIAEAQRNAAEERGGMMGGIMAVGSALMGVGLDMDQIRGVSRTVIGYAREEAGDEAIDGIVAAIPGLGQFI